MTGFAARARAGLAIGTLVIGTLAVGACSTDRTAILIEVSSADLAVPDDVDTLRFQAMAELGGRIDRSFAIAGSWPHSLTIIPPEGEGRGAVRIVVTGYRRERFVIRRVVSTAFEPGVTRRVVVDLVRACVGVECPEGVDCLGGMCVGGGDRDGGVLEGGASDGGPSEGGPTDEAGVSNDGGPDDGAATDGGLDAGDRDGGSVDASRVDASPSDAGSAEAGAPDAGRFDGGRSDAGPVDGGMRDGGRPRTGLVLNEVDYDQPGPDTAEFVEIHHTGADPIDLDGIDLVLINGSVTPAAPYATVALSGTLLPGQMLVVGSDAVLASLPSTARGIRLGSAIQNGDPDGIALWDRTRRILIDALSYGGAITMAAIGGDVVSLVAGNPTPARDSASAPRSVCRFPDGTATGDDATDWTTCATPTPGLPNVR
jgi:hypothetical protein